MARALPNIACSRAAGMLTLSQAWNSLSGLIQVFDAGFLVGKNLVRANHQGRIAGKYGGPFGRGSAGIGLRPFAASSDGMLIKKPG